MCWSDADGTEDTYGAILKGAPRFGTEGSEVQIPAQTRNENTHIARGRARKGTNAVTIIRTARISDSWNIQATPDGGDQTEFANAERPARLSH